MSARRPLLLERLHHVAGELLRSRDLADQVAGDQQLLWWHQRAVHDAYGVRHGLRVVRDPAAGAATVEPGLAFDCYGRELHVREQRIVALPAGGGAQALYLRYAGGPDAALAWLPRASARAQDGVALACEPPSAGDQPPFARPLASPRVFAAQTQPGGTAWAPWTLRGLPGAGIQVRVDTRAAGFDGVPCYFAWLGWPSLPAAAVPARIFAAAGVRYIQDEAADGFTFCAALPRTAAPIRLLRTDAGNVVFANNQRLYVCWLGIEHGPGEP